MKIRNVFVSNSSSSSFVIVCTVDDHIKAMEKLHPYYQAWVNQLFCHKESTFFGHKILMFTAVECGEIDTMYYDGKMPKDIKTNYDLADYEEGIAPVSTRDGVSAYMEALNKVTSDIIYHEDYH